jgi:[acyl-carrier-protein] S-malonyltransferase
MGKDLYETFPEARAIFDKAEEALGFELKKRCFQGPEDLLKMTNVAQPAIVTASIAAFEVLKARKNILPAYMAGLSLGEYSALIASGSLTFEDGIRLVKIRGQLMDDAARKYPGKMMAVLELDIGKIKDICLKSGAEIANLNCPGQVVISGKIEAIDKAGALCMQAGAKRVIPLEVSGAFHSSLMFEASAEFKLILENKAISSPQVAVISNYTALPQYKVTQIIENLVYQMRSPVRWEDSMRFILSQGITQFFEFGPGKVLKGLMRRIDETAQVVNIENREDILSLVESRK